MIWQSTDLEEPDSELFPRFSGSRRGWWRRHRSQRKRDIHADGADIAAVDFSSVLRRPWPTCAEPVSTISCSSTSSEMIFADGSRPIAGDIGQPCPADGTETVELSTR